MVAPLEMGQSVRIFTPHINGLQRKSTVEEDLNQMNKISLLWLLVDLYVCYPFPYSMDSWTKWPWWQAKSWYMCSTIRTFTKANLAIATAECLPNLPTAQKHEASLWNQLPSSSWLQRQYKIKQSHWTLPNSTGRKQTGKTTQLQTCATYLTWKRKEGIEGRTKSPESRTKSHGELFPGLET